MKRLLACTLLLSAGVCHGQEWTRVDATDRAITVDASGIVASANALRFGPPPNRSWRITITNLAREGTRVSEGDVLAEFDGSATDDRVRNLAADLNAKRSELESLDEIQAQEIEDGRVRLAASKSAAEKAARKADADADLYAGLEYRKLLEEKAIAETMYEHEQQRVEVVALVREAKRAELEADIRRLESELAGAQQELESFTIRAPRPGIVIIGTNRDGSKLDINSAVNPGIVIVELANEDDLVVQAEVAEYAAASIEVGQPAAVIIDAIGGNTIEGTVVEVASIVRRQSRYSQAMVRDVTVELPAATIASLRPGMSAKLSIVVDTADSALAVPAQSLTYRDGKPGVIVRGDGWRAVTLGRESAGQRIVESGIEAGEEVAL